MPFSASFSFNFTLFPVASPSANASNLVWLPGATGTSSSDLLTAWSSAFSALYPEADVTLTGIGSLAAQKALYGDLSCFDPDKIVEAICERGSAEETLWGVGDLPLQEAPNQRQVQQLPVVASAVSIVYSKDVTRDKLRMTFDVLSGIFNSSILYWDDPRLLELNPLVTLPHEPIRKMVRRDDSGQTALFTQALAARVPDTSSSAWPPTATGSLPEWPFHLTDPSDFSLQDHCLDSVRGTLGLVTDYGNDTDFAVAGTHGMIQSLLRIPYSIGYMDLGSFQPFSDVLEQVRLQTTDGTYVAATMDSLSRTMGGLVNQLQPESLQLDLTQPPTPPGGYPIAGYAYWYIKTSPDAYTDCYQAWLLCKWIEWSYLDPQATRLALAHGWLVPPMDVVNQTLAKLQQVQCYDTELSPPAIINALSYLPPPYRTQEQPDNNNHQKILWMTLLGGLLLATNGLILLVWWYDRRRLLQQLHQQQTPKESSVKLLSIKPILFTEQKGHRNNDPEADPLAAEETQNPSLSFDDDSRSETSISQLTLSQHPDEASSKQATNPEDRGIFYHVWSRLNEEVRDEVSI